MLEFGATRRPYILSASNRNAVALHQVAKHRADRLGLGADAAPRPVFWIPCVQVDMQPARCRGHESTQEQRTENRAGKRRRCDVAEISDPAAEFVIVGKPQRHWPEWIA